MGMSKSAREWTNCYSMLLHKLMIWTICLYATINFIASPLHTSLGILLTLSRSLFHALKHHIHSTASVWNISKSSHCVSLITIFLLCVFLQNVCVVHIYHLARLALSEREREREFLSECVCVCRTHCAFIYAMDRKAKNKTESQSQTVKYCET